MDCIQQKMKVGKRQRAQKENYKSQMKDYLIAKYFEEKNHWPHFRLQLNKENTKNCANLYVRACSN